MKNKLNFIFDLFYKRFYIFCIFRLTALKSFSRAVVFAIEATDFRCCSSWNDTLYFPVCLCAHFLATTVTNALWRLNVYDQNLTVNELSREMVCSKFQSFGRNGNPESRNQAENLPGST